MRVLGAVLVLLAGLGGTAGAQDLPEGAVPLDIEAIDATAYPQVVVEVVMPPELAGRSVPPGAFTLTEDGETREVEVMARGSDDLEVVVAIDTSGSMEVEAMEEAKAAALSFVDRLPAVVPVAVVGFGSEVTRVVPATTDREELAVGVASLESAGTTALYDAIGTALEDLAPRAGSRQVIVALSDGGDNASTRSRTAIVDELADRDVDLYIVELVTPDIDSEALRELATSTAGGQVVSADDPAALAAVFDTVAGKLLDRYALTVVAQSGGPTTIGVRVERGGVLAVGERRVHLPAAASSVDPEDATPAALPAARAGAVVVPGPLSAGWVLLAGAALTFLALAVLLVTAFAPPGRRAQLAGSGAGLGSPGSGGGLNALGERATLLAEGVLARGGRHGRLNATLERAGMTLRPAEFVVLGASVAVTVAALVGLMTNALIGLLGAVAVVVAFRLVLSVRTSRRQAAFADQLGEALQLMSGSLRAGYALLQAVDTVAREADAPASEEFRRLVVENRLGRDLHASLGAMAERVQSEDFRWVAEAIAIHAEVGGDLADVLEGVAGTVRERNELRRQVAALSAEGRLSAIVLFVLPFGVAAIISLSNPAYLAALTNSIVGYGMLGLGAVLLCVGGLWLRATIRLKY